MPLRPDSLQQMVWSDDVGGMAAKAFQQGDTWLGREIEVAGDALTGPQIAAVFSIVTGRPMHYKQGPPAPLLRLVSRDGHMMSTFIDTVGYCAHVGECRKLLPSMHTLEQALRATGWEGRASSGFSQGLFSCHTPDMWCRTCCCPCCSMGWVARNTNRSAIGCCLASFVAYPCVGAMLRGDVRSQYGIVGSCPLDWGTGLCCPLCAIVQQTAEVRTRSKQLVPQTMSRVAARYHA